MKLNSIFDEAKKNLKAKMVTKLKNSNVDQTQKPKI